MSANVIDFLDFKNKKNYSKHINKLDATALQAEVLSYCQQRALVRQLDSGLIQQGLLLFKQLSDASSDPGIKEFADMYCKHLEAEVKAKVAVVNYMAKQTKKKDEQPKAPA